jgi:TrmH family RNA methyltransferase
MLSKALLKQITSLELRKYRKESGLFIAEGGKTVTDLIKAGMTAEKIIATQEWLSTNKIPGKQMIVEATEEELKRASFLRTPQGVIGIFKQPLHEIEHTAPHGRLCLALDNVQDPGNLGTIIRIADWFGIEEIFCSIGSADAYNPKTIQATMGAIARVKVHYVDLPGFIASLGDSTPVYGTFLNGDDIYNNELTSNGLIVMGNEGNGISDKCASLISRRILIPNYPQGRITSESLNVSTATAIICSEFRRRSRK